MARPRFESNRAKPESPYGTMRQSSYTGAFQSIMTGLRRPSQNDGWSRSYEDGSQNVAIDKPFLYKSPPVR